MRKVLTLASRRMVALFGVAVVIFCVCAVALLMAFGWLSIKAYWITERNIDPFFGETSYRINGLMASIKNYKETYGRLPPSSLNAEICPDARQDNCLLMEILDGGTNLPTAFAALANPRGLSFFNRYLHYVNIDGASDLEYVDFFRYPVDAYGRTLNIYFDTNDDGVIKVGSNAVPDSVAIWSNGKNGKNEFGHGDDIANWIKYNIVITRHLEVEIDAPFLTPPYIELVF